MNIEIANRLVELRKKNNLSQEALAGKLGISRQAVSKWERAEASPDTDNLILLARLYGVSLDELLKTDEEILPAQEQECVDEPKSADAAGALVTYGGEWDGAGQRAKSPGEKARKACEDWFSQRGRFPMSLLIMIAYFFIGCVWGAWHPGWLLVFLIPIWDSLVTAIRKRNAYCFAYPVLVTLIYLCLGFFGSLWHPGWIVFLTIPLCYSLVGYFRGNREGEDSEWQEDEEEEGEDFNRQRDAGEAGAEDGE